MSRPEVTGFFDQATNTVSYVAADPATSMCAIIDSVSISTRLRAGPIMDRPTG